MVLTNPQPNQLGLAQIPQGAAIWSTINAQLANFSWKTDPATVAPNTAVYSDAAQYLVGDDKATVTFTPANGSNPATVAAASGGANPIAIDPRRSSAAQTALGAAAPANLTAARAAYIAAHTATTPDPTLIANLSTVFGAWGIARTRKNTLLSAGAPSTARAASPAARAAVRAEVFFGGLPGGLVTTRTVTADPVTAGTAARISLAIANADGRKATGDVALDVSRAARRSRPPRARPSNDAVVLHAPGPGRGHVRVHAVLRG